jgi:hypothetical protein
MPTTKTIATSTLLLLPLTLLACAAPAPEAPEGAVTGATASRLVEPRFRKTEEILGRVGLLAEGSLYSCLFHELMQGIPMQQAMESCETKLIEDDALGFGADSLPGMGGSTPFDPSEIVASCAAGDPTVGQSSGYGEVSRYGGYSWGGNPGQYFGLSREESLRLKEIAVQEAREANLRFDEAYDAAEAARQRLNEAKASGDAAAIAKAEAEYKKADAKAVDAANKAVHANRKAGDDPNRRPPNTIRPGFGTSLCEQTLAGAREFLRECNRNGWKTYECQKLKSQMNGCPDPALILVDPGQGYSCGEKPDAEAVREAAVKRCEQRVKYGPGGANPCEPMAPSDTGLFLRGPKADICNDPYAYVDPGQAACFGTFEIERVGQPDFETILAMALERFGGPIFVLPKPPLPFPGGPDPRPGPRP